MRTNTNDFIQLQTFVLSLSRNSVTSFVFTTLMISNGKRYKNLVNDMA